MEVAFKLGIKVDITIEGKPEQYLVTKCGDWGGTVIPEEIELKNRKSPSELPMIIRLQIPKIVTVKPQNHETI